MTVQETWFIVILIINLIVTIIYLILNLFWRKDNKTSFWVRIIVMLLCPVTGPLMLLISYIFFLLFFHREVDLEDVIFGKERVKSYVHADEDRERNLIPVEEAITVTDRENLRGLMLDVVRGDVRKSLSTISLALDSEDSETAHYAASILQDVLNDFRSNVQKAYQQMKEKDEEEERPERASIAHMLINYMDPVLKQHVFTALEQKNQVDILDDVCEMLYEADPESMDSGEYETASLRLLEVSEFERSRKWCGRAAERYPEALSTYTCWLKLYFSMGEKESFFQVMDELKQSGISIDRETLEMIRVFM